MKRRFTIYPVLGLLLGAMASSCATDELNGLIENDQESLEYSVMVNSFRLAANDTILADLDSVFFAIDLNRSVIFNPDSLPKGTNIGKLPVTIDLPGVSEATITMPSGTGDETTTVDYLENKNDSINFSKGEVTLHLKSYNGKVSRDYTIKVNIHKLEPDSLAWDKVAVRSLPGNLGNLTGSRTVAFGDEVFCYTTNGTRTDLSRCENPFSGVWTSSRAVTLPSGAKLRSITPTADALYLIDSSDNLYKSTDGSTWTATGTRMHHIYGGYLETLIGLEKASDGSLRHVSYPAGVSTGAIDASFPVEGTSNPVTYTTIWAEKPMMMITGGRTAAGKNVGTTWAFDGNKWACITQESYEMAEVTGATLIPYFSYTTNYLTWEATQHDMLFAIGGRNADGTIPTKFYISPDRGVHWTTSEGLMAKPDYLPGLYDLDGLVRDNTMYVDNSRTSGAWKEFTTEYPRWYYPVYTLDGSRAVTPIKEWECPFVYLFGGYLANGNFNDEVWRAVINRLLFRPIQ